MARIEDADIRKTLQVHATAIGALSTKVDAIEHKLGEHGGALSRIEMAVTRQDATRPASFKDNLDTASKLLGMGFYIVAGIIAVSVWAARPNTDTAALQRKHDDDRMARIERTIEDLAKRPDPPPRIVYRATAAAK